MVFPIVGNLPQIIAAGDISKFVKKKYRKVYGNVYTVEIGGVKKVVISGYENIRKLLVERADYTSNRTLDGMFNDATMFSKENPGMVWSRYPDWKDLRSLALHVMREEGMGKATMEPNILSEFDAYIERFIEPHLGVPINISMSLTFATSNIISQMVTGKRYDYDDPELHSINTVCDLVMKISVKTQMVRNVPLAAYFPSSITGLGMEDQMDHVIQPILSKMIEHARKNLDTVQNYFLPQALLRKESKDNRISDTILTDGNIRSTVGQLYNGGIVTTAKVLAWGLLYMILYPDVQEKVWKEINEVIGERQVSFKDRLSLPYVDAVVHEFLRCANILPLGLSRFVEREILIDGKVLPAGADLMLNMDSILSDPELYPEPQQFKPERFIGADSEMLKSKLPTFGFGRRTCLGEPLARMELFIIFVSLMQKYKVSNPPGQEPTLEPIISIVRDPQEYEIIFERRE